MSVFEARMVRLRVRTPFQICLYSYVVALKLSMPSSVKHVTPRGRRRRWPTFTPNFRADVRSSIDRIAMTFALFVPIVGFVPMAGAPRAVLTIPTAPTVSTGLTACMVVRRDSEHERVAEMPAQLTEWGCDEEMWTNLRASARKNLRRLATRGDPKGNAREVISNLRTALERDAGASSTPAGGQTKGAQVAQVDPMAAVPVVKAVAVESQAERMADGKAEGAVEEALKETAEEESDPSAGVEPEAPSAQPEGEPAGAPAPSGFSWGLTF